MTVYVYSKKNNKRVITIENVVTVFQVLNMVVIQDANGVSYNYKMGEFKVTLFTE